MTGTHISILQSADYFSYSMSHLYGYTDVYVTPLRGGCQRYDLFGVRGRRHGNHYVQASVHDRMSGVYCTTVVRPARGPMK